MNPVRKYKPSAEAGNKDFQKRHVDRFLSLPPQQQAERRGSLNLQLGAGREGRGRGRAEVGTSSHRNAALRSCSMLKIRTPSPKMSPQVLFE